MNENELPELLEDERIDRVNEQISLIQKKNGLTFGTDAYLLAAYVRPMPNARLADLGSGTGIIPLLLAARNKVKELYAVEIQSEFADLITRNATLNGFDERIHTVCADIRELKPATLGGELDVVTANPPYMRVDSGKRNMHGEKYIARHEVFGTVYDFCACAERLLRYGGRFVTVWRPDRLIDLVDALRRTGLEPKRMTFVHADESAPPCMVLTEAVKGASPSVLVSAPLVLYLPHDPQKNARILTKEAQDVYDSCKLFY